MKLTLFKSSLRTLWARILKIEILLVLAYLVTLSIYRAIYWHDPCNYASGTACLYTRAEDTFMILAFISTIAFILTHAAGIALSVRAIMKNRSDEPTKSLLGDTLMAGVGMPVALAIILFTLKPAMQMTGLIEGIIAFIENVRR